MAGSKRATLLAGVPPTLVNRPPRKTAPVDVWHRAPMRPPALVLPRLTSEPSGRRATRLAAVGLNGWELEEGSTRASAAKSPSTATVPSWVKSSWGWAAAKATRRRRATAEAIVCAVGKRAGPSTNSQQSRAAGGKETERSWRVSRLDATRSFQICAVTNGQRAQDGSLCAYTLDPRRALSLDNLDLPQSRRMSLQLLSGALLLLHFTDGHNGERADSAPDEPRAD